MISTAEEIGKYFAEVDKLKDSAKVPRDLVDFAILYELIKLNDNISNLKEKEVATKKTAKSGD